MACPRAHVRQDWAQIGVESRSVRFRTLSPPGSALPGRRHGLV